LSIESFQGFFTLMREKLAAQIEFVCSDMWPPYLDVIREKIHLGDNVEAVEDNSPTWAGMFLDYSAE
jgi:hypothetical protein